MDFVNAISANYGRTNFYPSFLVTSQWRIVTYDAGGAPGANLTKFSKATWPKLTVGCNLTVRVDCPEASR